MMLYADTSAVLRWIFNEAAGAQIFNALRKAEKVACSRLTLVETRRVIQRAITERRITEAEGADLLAVFGQAAAQWAILELTTEVARRAEGAFPVEPVRTLDAIHLASAIFLRESFPKLQMVSTDDRVRDNARQIGFVVLPDKK